MFRRAADENQLAGMWELPWAEGEPDEASERQLGRRYGGRWRLGERLSRARHAITNRRIEAELWRARLNDGGALAEGPEAGWHDPRRLAELPTASLDAKLLRAAEVAAGHRPGPRPCQ